MTDNDRKIRRILIFGGGIAGWMAAVSLNRLLQSTGVVVTLVESVRLGTAGVAEAADPALVRYMRELQVDEVRMMQDSSAIFNLGTKFIDWSEPSRAWWHPFGLCSGRINDIDLFPFWLKSTRFGRTEGPYSSYSLQALLAQQRKAPRPANGPSPIIERGEYSFQFDPSGLSDLLRELALKDGVNHLFDEMRQAIMSENGFIERVETTSGRSLSADLYLDCTDEGLLIERALGDPWISWSDTLRCDRSIVLPLPRDPTAPPHVSVTALSVGWMRRVTLSHRVACTYFYSSSHLSDDAAVRELLARAAPSRVSTAEPRYRKHRSGRRQTFWRGNCVALGQAAGSVEPLEPVETLFLQKSLELLIRHLPDQSCAETLVRSYNQRIAALYDAVRDFLHLHYAISRRTDPPFWSDVGSLPVPASLESVLDLHDENGYVAPELTEVFPETSYHHVFVGGKRLPRRPCTVADVLDFDKVTAIMQQMRTQNDEWLVKLPSHRELMEILHRPPV
jgi:tryptophan halogenase